MSTAYAAVAAIVLLAVLIPTVIHLLRAHRAARRWPTITEAEAREHSRPLSYAITAISPINPPKTEEPCPASPQSHPTATWSTSKKTTDTTPPATSGKEP